MATRRMIKSDIWLDDWFGQLDFFEQALWVGIFSKCADDQGRMLDNAVLMRAAIFPYKDIDPDHIDKALAGFAKAARIYRYEADGKKLIQILRWWAHQQQQWASASQWAAPGSWQDHVRTRGNNEYIEVNWLGKVGNANSNADWQPVQVNDSGEQDARALQPGGHVPVPVPVPEGDIGACAPAPESIPFDDPPAKAPEPKPKRKRRPHPASDPRSKTPAIQCARAVIGGRYPPKELYDDIIRILGETPDGEKLAECRKAWVAKGYNPNSWTWLLEWYADDIPDSRSRASPAPPPKKPAPTAWVNPFTGKVERVNNGDSQQEPGGTATA